MLNPRRGVGGGIMQHNLEEKICHGKENIEENVKEKMKGGVRKIFSPFFWF
jgi:hypothetical protein